MTALVQRIRTLLQKEHWWAEAWGALMLVIFGVYSYLTAEHVLASTAITHGFWLILPDKVWQGIFVAAGLWQLYALLTDSDMKRGIAAFVSTMLYVWATENQVFFAHGFKAVFLFIAGWIGVNLFALVRTIGGQR